MLRETARVGRFGIVSFPNFAHWPNRMTRRLKDRLGNPTHYDVQKGWDPYDLLHPAQAFEHPSHVVYDPDLTLNEKRAILASWASDACAPEANPHLRCSSQ